MQDAVMGIYGIWIHGDESLGGFTVGGEEPCPVCNIKEWLESVVDEDGEFKTREEALAYVEKLKKRYLNYE